MDYIRGNVTYQNLPPHEIMAEEIYYAYKFDRNSRIYPIWKELLVKDEYEIWKQVEGHLPACKVILSLFIERMAFLGYKCKKVKEDELQKYKVYPGSMVSIPKDFWKHNLTFQYIMLREIRLMCSTMNSSTLIPDFDIISQ
ncbi:MAG: hypothetical protein QW303_03265 [Nitrososphaerota archaeon]